MSQWIRRLYKYVVLIFGIVGVVQLIRAKAIRWLPVFKFPLYLFVVSQILFYVALLFSTKYSFLPTDDNLPWWIVPTRIFNLSFLILVFYHFKNTIKRVEIINETDAQPVSHEARFINRLIDILVITPICISGMNILISGNIFENIPFLKLLTQHWYWYFALCQFVYYLTFETIFLQTIGKLHNNSFVQYKKKRFTSILVRTICRFIPFEPFSFLGKKGWHDGASETTVIKVN